MKQDFEGNKRKKLRRNVIEGLFFKKKSCGSKHKKKKENSHLFVWRKTFLYKTEVDLVLVESEKMSDETLEKIRQSQVMAEKTQAEEMEKHVRMVCFFLAPFAKTKENFFQEAKKIKSQRKGGLLSNEHWTDDEFDEIKEGTGLLILEIWAHSFFKNF